MQLPTSFHHKLARLAGGFVGTETHHPFPGFPNLEQAEAKVWGRLDLNGRFLIREYETRRGPELLYKGLGVYSWDDQRGAYAVYWFDTAGTSPVGPAYGSWTEDKLEFHYQRGERRFRLLYQFTGADHYHFAIEQADDHNHWTPTISGDYERVPEAGGA